MPRTEISTIDEAKRPASIVARLLVQEGAQEKAVKRLLEGLDAETPQGNPDWKNQRDAAMAILSYTDGRPIEMVYQVTEKRVSSAITDLLATSEDREALRRQLDALDRHAEGKVVAQNKGVENSQS